MSDAALEELHAEGPHAYAVPEAWQLLDEEFRRRHLEPPPKLAPDPLVAPVYFPVSPLKLIAMSVCTWGIYDLYWYYRNWSLIKEREKLDIRPFWRAFFAFFFCYSCFKKIGMTAQSLNLRASIAVGPLAAAWIIFTLFWRLPDPYWLLTFVGVLFLVPVQVLVHEINESVKPGYEENVRFTAWNIAAVVVGGLLLLLAVVGAFIPSE